MPVNLKLLQSLSRTNLNLMLVFYTLYHEQHLTRTAEILCLSQPAVSHSLKKLREFFNDELFIKTSDGMHPTPMAQRIADTVEKGLFYFDEALNATREFAPHYVQREFRIGLTDYMNQNILPALMSHIVQHAPNISLNMLPVRIARVEETETVLRDNNLDIAIAELEYRPSSEGSDFVYDDQIGCIADKQLVGSEGVMTLDIFTSSYHLALSHREDIPSLVAREIKKLGLERKILAKSAHFSALGNVLPGSSLITVITELGARQLLAEHDCLRFYPLPFHLEPFKVSLLWDVRKINDPGIIWLRKLLISVMKQQPATPA